MPPTVTSTVASVFVPAVSGAGVFLHLHRVLAPSGVCDRPVPHGLASLRFLAGWCPCWTVVHSQQVGNTLRQDITAPACCRTSKNTCIVHKNRHSYINKNALQSQVNSVT